MRAIIIMGHGSNVPGAGDDIRRVAEMVKQKAGYEIVRTCHLSRAKPSFPETLAECVEMGATEIILIPYLLYSGIHVRKDIPELMIEEGKRYQGVKLIYGSHLGSDELLAELVRKRVEEAADSEDVSLDYGAGDS